jgi:hypothetical protein
MLLVSNTKQASGILKDNCKSCDILVPSEKPQLTKYFKIIFCPTMSETKIIAKLTALIIN